ncbi:MAG: hypothetical protein K9J16_05290 [Melioribacteraceae bacterium]|nr:hypothetical protein [Melioribacteraceae bacterium]MCF8392979.1 hypothetical protein [Melioribacteraceae bacterium]MCF8417278.1 hypothetical protein [Melioribacteraceae bacterium]
MFKTNHYIIKPFITRLSKQYEQNYGTLEPQYGSIISWAGSLALEIISNSDALYHNVEHTMMVTLAGQDIIRGKHLKQGGVTPEDWLHYILALLCHDIGYVRGICRNDTEDKFSTGKDGELVKLTYCNTDAILTEYHVDRGKQFVFERFSKQRLIDPERIAYLIEYTRFPPPKDEEYSETDTLRGLTRAADFIGQLGDPNYLRKTPALFYEFEETGLNEKIGYKNPGDLRHNYAKFYWKEVSPYIQDAIKYLKLTQDGKQWIASLHSHVFEIEHLEQNNTCIEK